MKKWIPSSVRLWIRVYQKHLKDLVTGSRFNFVNFSQRRVLERAEFPTKIIISQAIYSTAFSENKVHNLKLAVQNIENLTINPGQIVSFWHLVGNPDKSRGYLIGRSLINNELTANYGGGLCQLAGLMYFLAVKAGLLIIERSPHSQDIYTEETRFTPLGSDATVVYGYKDLRFQNNLTVPICFRFQVEENAIAAMLCSPAPICEYKIEFIHQPLADGVRVETLRYTKDGLSFSKIDSTIYKKISVPSPATTGRS